MFFVVLSRIQPYTKMGTCRIEPCPLPAAARLRVMVRTREQECGGMATHGVEGVDEDDGTGDLLDLRRPGAWE